MKKSLSTICLLIALLATMSQVRADFLYSGSRDDNLLNVIDPSDASTLDAITLSLPGEAIVATRGLAAHPVTGILWALLDLDSQSLHELVTIDPVTGAVTDIGTIDSSNSTQGLAFDDAGTLYRIDSTADLVTLSLADASSTFVKTLTDTGFWHEIAFNPLDGMMYHRSGAFFEKLDLGTLALTTIPGPIQAIPTGLTFSSAAGGVILAQFEDLHSLTPAGAETSIGSMDHNSGGLAFSSRALPSPSLPASLYGIDFNGFLWTIDPLTGSGRLMGRITEATGEIYTFSSAMDFDSSGTLYAIGFRSPGGWRLFSVDPITGVSTDVAPMSGSLNKSPGMSFRNSDNQLFVHRSLKLHTVDIVTAVGSAMSPSSGVTGAGQGLAFSPSDTLFYAGGDNLNTLDPVTGAGTFEAAFSFPEVADNNPRINAMDFQPGTGVLFGSLNDSSSGDGNYFLATISTNPGTVTIVGQTVGGLDALAFFPSSGPEGDGNGDGKTDAADLSFCAGLLGGVNATCDLDGDGTVEVEDLADLVGVIFGVEP